MRSKRWPTTPGLGPHPTCLLITEQTWNPIMDRQTAQKHLLHLAILEAPTDPLVQRAPELTQGPEDQEGLEGLQDDLGINICPTHSPWTWNP